ncbi:hypothetical protein MFFC18_08450 [Mariniblastus fucicola]|uniref:Uncharacterized protein n=1 Tax=Mariniblastus fucicola TaxID=980251 RepID=A0A5B9P440_9BACT|nr:hypothetical protein MFFC18_08450 [Mariniblastus fucicola]
MRQRVSIRPNFRLTRWRVVLVCQTVPRLDLGVFAIDLLAAVTRNFYASEIIFGVLNLQTMQMALICRLAIGHR